MINQPASPSATRSIFRRGSGAGGVKVVVEGINVAKRHTKPTKANQQGGIMDKEMPIDISNVQLVCPSCGRPTRIGHRIEDGKKIRICRKCGSEL